MATLLPTLRADLGAVRTSDPVAVFGLRLRQRELSAADFDPLALTRPDPRSAMTGGVELLVPIFSPEQRLLRRAAAASANAATATAQRMRQLAERETALAWLGVQGAREQLRAVEAGIAAGEAAVTQANAFLRAGTATRADVLLAEVRVNELRALRSVALDQQRVARLGLALAMGVPGDTVRAVPTVTVATDTLLAALRALDAEALPVAVARADVRAAQETRRAADAGRALAGQSLVPRLQGMVRREWNSRTEPWGAAPYTTAGVMLQWAAFSGGAELGARQTARAHAAAAAAAADATTAAARMELARSRGSLHLAAEQLDLAEQAASQAAEAERLVRLRYDGGLATIAELLGASSTRTQSAVRRAAARLDALTTITTYRVSAGLDLAPVLRLTQ